MKYSTWNGPGKTTGNERRPPPPPPPLEKNNGARKWLSETKARKKKDLKFPPKEAPQSEIPREKTPTSNSAKKFSEITRRNKTPEKAPVKIPRTQSLRMITPEQKTFPIYNHILLLNFTNKWFINNIAGHL